MPATRSMAKLSIKDTNVDDNTTSPEPAPSTDISGKNGSTKEDVVDKDASKKDASKKNANKKDTSEKGASKKDTQDLVKDLEKMVGRASKEAIFACGGQVPIWTDHHGVGATQEKPGSPIASTPIALRWDAPQNKSIVPESLSSNNLEGKKNAGSERPAICKLIFPVLEDDEPNLDALVSHCLPATFGLGNKDVLDLDYRRAGKMDPEAFSTTFNPYDLGIIDTIAQMLLPNAKGTSKRNRGVRAELYKLNVSSGGEEEVGSWSGSDTGPFTGGRGTSSPVTNIRRACKM